MWLYFTLKTTHNYTDVFFSFFLFYEFFDKLRDAAFQRAPIYGLYIPVAFLHIFVVNSVNFDYNLSLLFLYTLKYYVFCSLYRCILIN